MDKCRSDARIGLSEVGRRVESGGDVWTGILMGLYEDSGAPQEMYWVSTLMTDYTVNQRLVLLLQSQFYVRLGSIHTNVNSISERFLSKW